MNTEIWNFVEKYYPNYYSSGEILHNEDLLKLLEGEVNTGADSVYNVVSDMLIEEFLGIEPSEEQVLERVQDMYNQSLVEIYELAIQGYLETFKTN
jgi:hypothetical protein